MFGNIAEFNGDNEEWHHYIEKMNHFFAANGIDDQEKQRQQQQQQFLISPYSVIYKNIIYNNSLESPDIGSFFLSKNCFTLLENFR